MPYDIFHCSSEPAITARNGIDGATEPKIIGITTQVITPLETQLKDIFIASFTALKIFSSSFCPKNFSESSAASISSV